MIEPNHQATSRAWSWRHAIGKSGLPPITRLVLHTLGLKMDATGGSCFPPISEVVELTGLDKKTVLKHLDIAEEHGWIEISQHGFRGQKWKRNEYIARWPGRDIVGERHADIEDEGGGAAPPPSETKVVEMPPEGGGNGSIKVVEQLHQDKILPTNIPINSPAPSAGDGRSADYWKKREREFKVWYRDWPTMKDDSETYARAAWNALSDEDRAICIQRTPEHIEAVNRKTTYASTYLKEKAWEKLPPVVVVKDAVTPCNPLSKGWNALVLVRLNKPAAALTLPPKFILDMIKNGQMDARADHLNRLKEQGWPQVTDMYGKARARIGAVVPAAVMDATTEFEAVEADSELFQAWQSLFEKRGWPWYPVGTFRWLHMPKAEGLDVESALSRFYSQFEKEKGNEHAA
jgi:hypothetical protein